MEIQYVYQKKRSEFGRQCMFRDKGPDLIDNYPSNKEFLTDYILRNPISQGMQCAAIQAEHSANTIRVKIANSGINHTEGGWPKDVNIHDEESTRRYRRKIEKDDNFNPTMMQLCKSMESCILQNNAINIYQQYFSDTQPMPLVEPSSARTVNVYPDPQSLKRAVNHISWSPDETKLAVTHCNIKFQQSIPDESADSYIWMIEDPNKPLLTLKPPDPIVCLEYNQKDANSLVSGQYSGKVAVWDVRRGSNPVDLCEKEVAHRDIVYNVLWINSKTGTEFFSASADGQIKWWDTRKLNSPYETLILSSPGQLIEKSVGASCLEYESTIPTRFMVGVENGTVISCNRKGKSPSEKMGLKFAAHLGPVLAINRNPAYLKAFLSVGDWTAKIFSEDCRESPIMWTSYYYPTLTDGCWSPARFSVFFTTRSDGILDVWDILLQQRQACLGLKVTNEPLCCIRVSEMGRLLAVGNAKGSAYLVQLSENLATCNKNDKMLLTSMFEREGRRERILEMRNREIKLLKQKVQSQAELEAGAEGTPKHKEETHHALGEDPELEAAEVEFFRVIDYEINGPPPLEEPEALEEYLEPAPPPPTPPKIEKKGKKDEKKKKKK